MPITMSIKQQSMQFHHTHQPHTKLKDIHKITNMLQKLHKHTERITSHIGINGNEALEGNRSVTNHIYPILTGKTFLKDCEE